MDFDEVDVIAYCAHLSATELLSLFRTVASPHLSDQGKANSLARTLQTTTEMTPAVPMECGGSAAALPLVQRIPVQVGQKISIRLSAVYSSTKRAEMTPEVLNVLYTVVLDAIVVDASSKVVILDILVLDYRLAFTFKKFQKCLVSSSCDMQGKSVLSVMKNSPNAELRRQYNLIVELVDNCTSKRVHKIGKSVSLKQSSKQVDQNSSATVLRSSEQVVTAAPCTPVNSTTIKPQSMSHSKSSDVSPAEVQILAAASPPATAAANRKTKAVKYNLRCYPQFVNCVVNEKGVFKLRGLHQDTKHTVHMALRRTVLENYSAAVTIVEKRSMSVVLCVDSFGTCVEVNPNLFNKHFNPKVQQKTLLTTQCIQNLQHSNNSNDRAVHEEICSLLREKECKMQSKREIVTSSPPSAGPLAAVPNTGTATDPATSSGKRTQVDTLAPAVVKMSKSSSAAASFASKRVTPFKTYSIVSDSSTVGKKRSAQSAAMSRFNSAVSSADESVDGGVVNISGTSGTIGTIGTLDVLGTSSGQSTRTTNTVVDNSSVSTLTVEFHCDPGEDHELDSVAQDQQLLWGRGGGGGDKHARKKTTKRAEREEERAGGKYWKVTAEEPVMAETAGVVLKRRKSRK